MVKAIPDGYSSVCPWIISTDTGRVIDFMVDAFGAEEIARVSFDGAIGHAEVRLGDSMVLLFDSRPTWPATPAFLRLYLENACEVFDRAVQAGAEPITAMTEMYWGDIVGRVRDPLGNVWWIQE